jgi:two-component system sensor histidine kinase/response regulator
MIDSCYPVTSARRPPINSVSPSATLFIVDDQERNLRVLGTMLGQLGFEIELATCGEEALQRFAEHLPDLILLDVVMPGLDGFEVLRRIHSQPELAGIPVIFLSAADDKDLIVRALEAGAVDYVTKPFNRAELVSRVRTHLALKQARDRLRQLAEDKDELLGILAHDLKNHLGGMQMSVQLMYDRARQLADGRLERMSANTLRATDQMLSFLMEYLANAAADRGFTIGLESVSLTEEAATAIQHYVEAARRKELTLHQDFAPGTPLVWADPMALGQVIDNLVSNAVKFSPSGKSIWITVGPGAEGCAECRIRDEGPGCSAEDLRKMFRRYQRLSALPTAGEPSTGLGLSIAKRHVEAMNGGLRCESEVGRGATYILTLPGVS